VLYYVAAKTWPLKKYGELLNNKAQVEYLYVRCLRLRQKALENAIKHRRTEDFGGVLVQWLDVSYLTAEYPPKGGVVQGLHEHFEKEGSLVTVGYDKERVIFRLNGGARSAGFAANAFIAELKNSPGIVASGGGHAAAASLRLKPGKLAAVLDCLEKKFRETFGGS
ncbi:MAG TPA: hypothetical protein VI874_04935, partial [Candidatus Norongarragalinales archaeon]|nr:hypothetical protein [Candidatus Norongarragalinales archaeon]